MSKEAKTTVPFSDPLWVLEDIFPEPMGVLHSNTTSDLTDPETLIVLDTNVLLVPFNVGTSDLSEISKIYRRLINEGRLKVPARVLREYGRLRDSKLAEIAKLVLDKSSQIGAAAQLPPLLKGLTEQKALEEAAEPLKAARSAYQKAAKDLAASVTGWRGNDPLTAAYRELFSEHVVIEHLGERDAIAREWRHRLEHKIPPGYKDGAKPDEGIGDFLIWKSILDLGTKMRRNLVLVTGEEKPDWFVRGNSEGIYPRPELVDEYRRASGGKSFNISNFANLLLNLKAPSSLVKDVREAERFVARGTDLLARAPKLRNPDEWSWTDWYQTANTLLSTPNATLDFEDGYARLFRPGIEGNFVLNFVMTPDGEVYCYDAYSGGRLSIIADGAIGESISIDQLAVDQSVQVETGQLLIAQSPSGEILVARIMSLRTDPTTMRGTISLHVNTFSRTKVVPILF